jgi:hypothetical protein
MRDGLTDLSSRTNVLHVFPALLSHRSRTVALAALFVELSLMCLGAITASPASAANSYTWFSVPAGNGTPRDVWHSVTTGAQYNRAKVTTYGTDQATAWVSISGLGTSRAPSVVQTSFSYRKVTAKCLWNTPTTTIGRGPLVCHLGY